MSLLRPCVRREFPNFLFSQVSEMFGFQSLEFLLREKLVPTQKLTRRFDLKFGMQGLTYFSFHVSLFLSYFFSFHFIIIPSLSNFLFLFLSLIIFLSLSFFLNLFSSFSLICFFFSIYHSLSDAHNLSFFLFIYFILLL